MPAPASRGRAGLAAPAFVLSGCSGLQSALDPIGPAAREIGVLWWVMFAGSMFVFALVLGALLYAVYGRGGRRRIAPLHLIVGGGIVLPVVTLSILVPFNINVAADVSKPAPDDALIVHVQGRQWWWDIEYEDPVSGTSFSTANEIWLPLNRPVELVLTSHDVIHSLWFPRLAGKLDLIPGRTNRLVVEADTAGVFRGQCAEFCGVAHAKMSLYAVTVPPRRYAEWAQQQQRAARRPDRPEERRGASLFRANGCLLCHAVRGEGAWGQLGPDLTHVGGRMTIGAGLLETSRENLELWIAHNSAVKEGNLMPDYADLSPDTRDAIAAYLESLE